jgi:hypothetical protein
MPISAETLQRIRDNDPTLTSLNLVDNQITDAEAQALAVALRTNTTLTSLNLMVNYSAPLPPDHSSKKHLDFLL